MNKEPIVLKWDKYSDQPHVIKDKALKRQIYKQVGWDFLKTVLTNALIFPVAILFYGLIPAKKKQVNTKGFFGLSINLDKNPEATRALIDDLQVNRLLIRMPLHDIEQLTDYVNFAEQYKDKELLINILQDRRHIESPALLQQSLHKIFEQFSHLTHRFQIGNAINRKKWAIFSMDEYMRFYKVAYDLRNKHYPALTLLGSSIIDFEYYFTIRTLFNRHQIYFDECSTLLYVDRRGAPENTQMGLDLQKKLRLLQSILRLSPKSKADIVITETNWPITNTQPYAPTSEKECVSLDDHASFLVRYYLLALASGVVKNVYWHQLIAPGYGLIDNRDGELIKYPAYQAFKVMLLFLKGAILKSLTVKDGLYRLMFSNGVEVVWFFDALSVPATSKNVSKGSSIDLIDKQAMTRDGEVINTESVVLGSSPIYLLS